MAIQIKILLDLNLFVAERAFYFRKIDELRETGTLITFHNETRVNIGEEKRSIGIDDRGQGRLQTTDGKGNHLRVLPRIVFPYTSI